MPTRAARALLWTWALLGTACGSDEMLPRRAAPGATQGAEPQGTAGAAALPSDTTQEQDVPLASTLPSGALAPVASGAAEPSADAQSGCIDGDNDGVSVGCGDAAFTDCDDGDPLVGYGLVEVCDERDNDCDGDVDEGVLQTFYEDLDADGVGTSEATHKGCAAEDGYAPAVGDCDDEDPDNASACARCVDLDHDGAFAGCDRYVERSGPDCDDNDSDVQTSCNTCLDADRDGVYLGCDRYDEHAGPDCDDNDPDRFKSCTSCIDRDADGSFIGCDQYLQRLGPDCDDNDRDNQQNCERCADLDADGAFAGCDAYYERSGPDCDDGDADNWSMCDRCIDRDADDVYVGCDRYSERAGPDCNDLDEAELRECRSCVDHDGDGYYATCDFTGFLAPDCDDYDTDNFAACATCLDRDADDAFVGCDRFVERAGPDCDDADTDNLQACRRCTDRDGDGYFLGCDRYTERNGPDCADNDVGYQVRCEAPPPTGGDCLDDQLEVRCFAGNDSAATALSIDPFADEIAGQILGAETDWYAFELPAGCLLDVSIDASEYAPASQLSTQLSSADGEVLHDTVGPHSALRHQAGDTSVPLLLSIGELGEHFVDYRVRLATNCVSPGLEVAFIGDLSLSQNAVDVLTLIANEQVDLVVHSGDIDYLDSPNEWDEMVSQHLGLEVPYLTVIGNHDAPMWYPASSAAASYQAIVLRQHGNIRGLRCEGELGVRAKCRYRGLVLVESGIGTLPDAPDDTAHVNFLDDSLRDETSLFRVCAWHKNQRDLQLGGKSDEVGWLAYATCAAHGAIIMTAHEHSYARSYTLTDFSEGAPSRAFGMSGRPERVEVGPNRTFVTVSGLGGHSIRTYDEGLHGPTVPSWWASAYTSNRYVNLGKEEAEFESMFGALFVRFGVDGDPRRAHGTFKAVDGSVIDDFDIVSTN